MANTLNNNNSNMFEIHHHQLGSVTSGSILYGNNPLVSCSNPQLNWVFGGNNKNGSRHHQDQLISVPSLYSSQHQQCHQTSSANMSATALLQKAAQIGATSTDRSFLGTLGLKCSNSHGQEGNKFCGIYGSGSVLVSSLESETENPAKRRNIQQKEENNNGGEQTRDFLGVGIESICHAAPINGWI
ncbi:zinc finger protein NUTCRACKER-like [Neltuma alba]|uniref:zinc finger protein NUTCRACKER-like n=1 Tax=Neltuma alba TaxID=207710 RepID=UPI0010A3F06F|nr:zinc finger protein NUTCRACKER-like [Prosopis alba]